MGKIGDLFVRLGLKNSEFKKGMAEAQATTTGLGDKFKSLKGVAVGVWGAITAAVIAFARDAIKMTQKWGDAWAITMSGVKEAYGTFVRQLSSGDGWDNLFANMAEAYRRGKEIAAVLDEIFERKISYGYDEATTMKQVSELQLIMRDASKSDAERKAAAEEIIRLETELGNRKKAIWTDEARAMRDRFQLATGLNDAQTDFLLKNYNENREAINAGRAYLAERSRLEKELAAARSSYGSGAMSDAAYASIQARIDAAEQGLADLERSTSQGVKDIAELTRQYDKSNDELVAGMAQAEVAAINVDTEINRMKMRATATLGTLNNRIDTRQPDSGETALPDAKIVQGGIENDPMLEAIREEIDALEALAAETEEVTDASDAMYERWRLMHGLPPIEEVIDPDIADIIQQADANLQQFGRDLEKTEKYAVDLEELLSMGVNSAVQGFSDALQEMFDQLFSLDEGDADAVFAALLKPLAETAKKMGEIMLAAGVGMTAFGEALKNPTNAPMLIAAGAALIAIGAAASAALSSLAGGGASGATATTSTGAGMTGATTSSAELTVYVKGTVKGSDIILSGEKTTHEWGK